MNDYQCDLLHEISCRSLEYSLALPKTTRLVNDERFSDARSYYARHLRTNFGESLLASEHAWSNGPKASSTFVRKLRYGADARDDEQDANGAEHEANRSGNWENTCKAPPSQ